VKQIVELHGGSVTAASGGLGQGSTFIVKLPLAKHSGQVLQRYPMGEVNQSRTELAGIKVLVVDDELDTRDLLALVLNQFGAEVRAVDSAKAALAEIETFHPHVLISDIGMPEQDGYDLLRAVRKSGNKLPAIALTAFARSEDRTRALAEGYQAHLAKPVEPRELISMISRVAAAR